MRSLRSSLLAAIPIGAGLAASAAGEARIGRDVRLEIFEPAAGADPVGSVERIGDPAFQAFAAAVVAGLPPASATLRFVALPLVTSGDRPLPPLPADPPAGAGASCRITAPWFDLSVTRGGMPAVAGTLRWNLRQLLSDQAALAGLAPAGDAARPFARSSFDRLADLHAATPGMAASAGLPGELRWLFGHAPRSAFGRFADGAEAFATTVGERLAPRYARLATLLIGRCLKGDERRIALADIHAARRLTRDLTY
ncbi:MAG: hypothetical protein PGN09_08870 [Sphingomonas fennica]